MNAVSCLISVLIHSIIFGLLIIMPYVSFSDIPKINLNQTYMVEIIPMSDLNVGAGKKQKATQKAGHKDKIDEQTQKDTLTKEPVSEPRIEPKIIEKPEPEIVKKVEPKITEKPESETVKEIKEPTKILKAKEQDKNIDSKTKISKKQENSESGKSKKINTTISKKSEKNTDKSKQSKKTEKTEDEILATALANAKKNAKSGKDRGAEQGDQDILGGEGLGDANGGYSPSTVYARRCSAVIKKNWSWARQSIKGLRGLVWLRFDSTGKILERKIKESSGDSDFDNSILAAVDKTRRLPKPYEGLPLELTVDFNDREAF